MTKDEQMDVAFDCAKELSPLIFDLVVKRCGETASRETQLEVLLTILALVSANFIGNISKLLVFNTSSSSIVETYIDNLKSALDSYQIGTH